MPISKISELKRLNPLRIVRFKRLADEAIVLRDVQGQEYHLPPDTEMSKAGSHLKLSDKTSSVILPLALETSRRNFLITIVATIIIAFTAISIPHGILKLFFKENNATIEQRIEQLESVKRSLRGLDRYVQFQQQNLYRISETLRQMRDEKTILEDVAVLKREQIETLLTYQTSYEKRERWIGYGISYIIGALSSLSVFFLIQFVKVIMLIAKQEKTQQENPADTE